MAKKRKKPSSKPGHKQPPKTVKKLADNAFAAGQFKSALDLYKRLWKLEQSAEILAQLQACYLHRAQALAAKKMYQEAASVWENSYKLGACTTHVENYIFWLLNAGKIDKAIAGYCQHHEAMTNTQQTNILPHFAALQLTGKHDLANQLPKATLIQQHYQLVCDAISAYQQQSDEQFQAAVRNIPYRSPYRDFCQILKALFALTTDSDKSLAILQRIAKESAFANTAHIIQLAITAETDELLSASTPLQPLELAFVAEIRGWSPAQLKLLQRLKRLHQKPSAYATFEFILHHLPDFPDLATAKQLCYNILPHYSYGLEEYEQHFGTLPIEQKQHLHALAAEIDFFANNGTQNEFEIVLNAWQMYVKTIETISAKSPNTNLTCAAIYQHIVNICDKAYGQDASHNNERIECIECILHYDPHNEFAYHELITCSNKKTRTKWINQAITHCPNNHDFLLLAIEDALTRSVYTKAIQLAKQLLQLDPINHKANTFLLLAQTNRARLFMQKKKFSKAEAELAAAQSLPVNDDFQTANVLSAVLAFATGKATDMPNLDMQLPIRFALLLEAQRFNHDCKAIEKAFNLTPIKKLNITAPTDVVNLINAYHRYDIRSDELRTATINRFNPIFSKLDKLQFTYDEMSTICKQLDNHKHYPLLKKFNNIATKRWHNDPLFTFYKIIISSKGCPCPDCISDHDMDKLQQGLADANKQHNHKTIALIEPFFDAALARRMPADFFQFFSDMLEE